MAETMTKAPTQSRVPERSELDPKDCWDLSRVYKDVQAWEADFRKLEDALPRLASYRGRLGESPETLAQFLEQDVQSGRILRNLSTFAHRKSDEDTTNSTWKGYEDRIVGLSTRLGETLSFADPEILSIPEVRITGWLTHPKLATYRFSLEQVLRNRPHTLGEKEERILALAGDMADAPQEAFSQLHNADLRFGTIPDENGEPVEVTHGRYHSFLSRPDRGVRKRFFDAYYAGFESVKHTLAATLAGGIKRNVFFARARAHRNARTAALFRSNIPESVYDGLVQAVDRNLGLLHRYYVTRKRVLGLDEIHFYDLFVPIVPRVDRGYSFEEAVGLIERALAPLGPDYTRPLVSGLLSDWVDRYENRGKRSGAYCACCYDADPFLLLNYRDDTLDSVFTLAHEAGHAMHSYFSRRHQPPHYYSYATFVAEVASTFNEALLFAHLLETTDDPRMRAYLLARELDDIRSTIFRQTMFAEFERDLHARVEANEPLTLADITRTYHALLERYLGPAFAIDPALDLECLRVPHFYYNFYVFQYATGLSAALALASSVLGGEPGAKDRYRRFLGTGGSKFPIEILRDAGIDMESPRPVEAALEHFGRRLDELESLLGRIG